MLRGSREVVNIGADDVFCIHVTGKAKRVTSRAMSRALPDTAEAGGRPDTLSADRRARLGDVDGKRHYLQPRTAYWYQQRTYRQWIWKSLVS